MVVLDTRRVSPAHPLSPGTTLATAAPARTARRPSSGGRGPDRAPVLEGSCGMGLSRSVVRASGPVECSTVRLGPRGEAGLGATLGGLDKPGTHPEGG
ncbi:hypothetical protein GCM10023339_07380 [Alloalcanivorax gelatiniphagus]